jgi:hypothetical protein
MLYVVNAAMTPDFNRDGKIDDMDKTMLAAKGMFRFWINDDRDKGDFGTDAEEDSPEGSYTGSLRGPSWYNLIGQISWWSDYVCDRDPNCTDGQVNGKRDLVDFFPVKLDIPLDVLPSATCTYTLKQVDGAVNFAYTTLKSTDVKSLYTNLLSTGFGPAQDTAADSAPTVQITAGGVALNTTWLQASNTVIMLEGRACTTNPLVLEISENGTLVGSWTMGISVSSVSNMIRYLNIRTNDAFFTAHSGRQAIEGQWGTRLSEPTNYPDGFYNSSGAAQKTIIAVHGLDWDESETPAGHAEIFKRLFQSGLTARYIGVSWASDMGRRYGAPIIYGTDVIGAFVAAPYVTAGLSAFCGSNTVVMAHSLGNILVSSAIADHGMSVGKYIMFNAAVPVEAYDGRGMVTSSNQLAMMPSEWKNTSPPSSNYCQRVMSAAWNKLFSTNDPRSVVTWDGRFSGVTAASSLQVYQFYSTGEEILRDSDGAVPDLVDWNDFWPWASSDSVYGAKERVWAYNEMTKGNLSVAESIVVPNHRYAGWRFNSDYDTNLVHLSAADAALIATTNLVAAPFLRIPTQTGHPFRLISDTCSDSNRTPVPIDIGHLERSDSEAG